MCINPRTVHMQRTRAVPRMRRDVLVVSSPVSSLEAIRAAWPLGFFSVGRVARLRGSVRGGRAAGLRRHQEARLHSLPTSQLHAANPYPGPGPGPGPSPSPSPGPGLKPNPNPNPNPNSNSNQATLNLSKLPLTLTLTKLPRIARCQTPPGCSGRGWCGPGRLSARDRTGPR